MRKKQILTLCLTGLLMIGNVMPAFAGDISGVSEDKSQTATADIVMIKENPAPEFTVGIPASVTITEVTGQNVGKGELKFTISTEEYDNIPKTQKVAISIADAGYGDVTGEMSLYSEDADAKVTYGVYATSSWYSGAYQFEIGSTVASFDSNIPVSIVENGKCRNLKYIYVENYDEVTGGTYEGYMTFNIEVVDR